MKPSIIYQQRISDKVIEPNQNQLEIVSLLDEYYDHFQHKKNSSLRAGIYLWGTVGSGKTMLLDIFYDELPNDKKQRMHFHEFINQIHSELKAITSKQDPLTIITKQFAKTTKFLFLDEFIVSDISNAIILKNLLSSLIEHGVFIITSSNTAPHDLYHDGINRELFLPAIAFIEENFDIAKLSSGKDYRTAKSVNNNNYFYPNSPETELMMQQQFESLHESSQNTSDAPITVCARDIAVIKTSSKAVWFDFGSIIMPPRSYQDYLYLADNFKYIFISNLRPIDADEINLIVNFCHLIDICYDKEIRLILSATCPLADIFKYHLESKTILRTKSRLIAMQ